MVTEEVATTAEQLPDAAMVLVTVYVPAVLDDKVIKPVAAFSVNPAGADVNVPAMPPPLKVGDGLVPLWQYGLPV